MPPRNASSGATKLPDHAAALHFRAAEITAFDAEPRRQADNQDEVRRAWEALPASLFGTDDERRRVREAFVQLGLFQALSGACRAGAGHDVDACAALALSAPEVRAVRGHRSIVQAWIGPLRPAASWRSRRLEAEDRDEPERDREPASGRRPASFQRVIAQRKAIVDAMRKGHLGRAAEMIEDLCAYQGRDKPIHLTKSLCSLAASARRLGLHALQGELTERATRLSPDVPWAWNQRGEALRRTGDVPGALRAHDRAMALGDELEAPNGRAYILKGMGRFEDALQIFEDTLRAHPESVFARHGRAEVLRTMGRLVDALDAYDVMLLDDPGDAFAKTGRAVIFKAQRRFEEALAVYDAVVREHPEYVAAATGRADVLKQLGRYDEALAAYDAAAAAFPESLMARTGRADVLKHLARTRRLAHTRRLR